jgi:2-keto-3-deoxy-L-rhamnonate aldolase RhmA
MIETAAGLQAVEAILAVDGIDGVYVGPADLGLSLGLGHAQFPATAELEPALGRVVAAAGQAGKVPGIHAASEHFAPRYVQMGFRLLSLGGLGSFVSTGVVAALRRAGGTAEAPGSTAVSPY